MRRARDEAQGPLTGRRRLLRYAAVAFAALAFAYGARAWQAASRDVTLVYHAPAGVLRVTLTDGDGDRLRHSVFYGSERGHIVQMAEGPYTVTLEVDGVGVRKREIQVTEIPTIEVRW